MQSAGSSMSDVKKNPSKNIIYSILVTSSTSLFNRAQQKRDTDYIYVLPAETL